MDKLLHMFQLQHDLNRRCGVVLSNENREEWVLKFAHALSQEVAELVETTNYRWWRDKKKFDTGHAKLETVDLLCFVISIAQTLNLDADTLYTLYTGKMAINNARQDARGKATHE